MTNSRKNTVSLLSSTAILLAAALALTSCPARTGSGPSGSETTTLYSDLLGIRLTYDPATFPEVVHSPGREFPLELKAGRFSLAVKRIRGAGVLLSKDPQADFFQFFGQQVRYNLIDDLGLKPLEREVDEEFTAQGRPGLRQTLHFQVPEKPVPGLKQFEAVPGGELYLYYHHFYVKPDYYYFVLIADHALPPETLQLAVSLIEATQFNAEPAPEDAGGETTG